MTLVVRDVSVSYGRVRAVSEVSFRVAEGELVGLVGPNGAGKTTLLRSIVGLTRPAAGTIEFQGRRLDGKSVESIGRAGIRLVPEGRRILASLTVAENLKLGATGRRDRTAVAADMDEVCDRFPILRTRLRTPAGQLSGGEQQMLAIGRALLARPALLLLDEPTLGLAPLIVDQVFEILDSLRSEGMTMLLVEQNAHRTLALADYSLLLSGGKVVLEGTRAELVGRNDVVEAYLGV